MCKKGTRFDLNLVAVYENHILLGVRTKLRKKQKDSIMLSSDELARWMAHYLNECNSKLAKEFMVIYESRHG